MNEAQHEIDAMLARIMEVARRRGYNQGSLEVAAGLAKNRFSKWISDKQGEPTARQLHRFAKLLATKMEYFLEGGAAGDGEAFPSKMDHVYYIARELGADEAMRRLLAEPRESHPDRAPLPREQHVPAPAAPEVRSGRSPNPPVNPPAERRKGKTG
jgi:hypothetical protein